MRLLVVVAITILLRLPCAAEVSAVTPVLQQSPLLAYGTIPASGSAVDTFAKRFKPSEPVSNASVSISTKAKQHHVLAGRRYWVSATLQNNVRESLPDVVFKFTLQSGLGYLEYIKGTVFPPMGAPMTPSVEQQGFEVVWRDVYMAPGKRRYFTIQVQILCGAPTPLAIRPYATMDRTSWITGPEAVVRLFRLKLFLRFARVLPMHID